MIAQVPFACISARLLSACNRSCSLIAWNVYLCVTQISLFAGERLSLYLCFDVALFFGKNSTSSGSSSTFVFGFVSWSFKGKP
jgi:hypothetical protein